MAAVAIVATVVSAVSSFVGQKKQQREMRRAADEERKQRALANRQQALERQRNIRQAVAQQRVLRAQVLNANFAQGAGSSVAQGQSAAVAGDLATSVGSANTQLAAARGIAQSQDRQSDFMQRAQGNFFTDLSKVASVFSSASTNRGFVNFMGK